MYRITILNETLNKTCGDVQPNLNEVKRYLFGRVADVRAEPGTYRTKLKGRFGLSSPEVVVTVEELHRVK